MKQKVCITLAVIALYSSSLSAETIVRVGSKEECRTLEEAITRLSSLPKGSDVVIQLSDECIKTTQPMVINRKTSGELRSLVIRGNEKGKTVLSSSVSIDPKELKPIKDPIVKGRLRKELQEKIKEYDLSTKAINVKRFPEKFMAREQFPELYFEGKRLPLSRYPNQQSMCMKQVIEIDGKNGLGGSWEYTDPRHSAWLGALDEGLWMTGFWRIPWQPETVRIHAIDTINRQVTLAKAVAGGIGSKYHRPKGSGAEPYFVINIPEEIDQPGEWCIDFKRQKLYLYPISGKNRKEQYEIAFSYRPLLKIEKMENVTLERVTFEGGASDGVVIEGGKKNRLLGCTFRNFSGSGIVIDMGEQHEVRSSDFYALGKEGIWIMGGDRRTLTSCNHLIENNYFTRFGQVKDSWASAVRVGRYTPSGGDSGGEDAVGVTVRHNLVHDAPHSAFLYVGNLNVFEYNEVFDIAKTTGDVGAFYTRHDWTARGNVLRHNFIHHVPRANGTYHDDGHAGDSVYSNIIHEALAGTMIGGGHYNVVTDNIYLNCIHAAISIDSRGKERDYTTNNPSYTYRFRQYNFDSPNWQKYFPQTKEFLSIERPDLPHENVIENNHFINCKMGLRKGTADDFRFSPRLSGGQSISSDKPWIDLLLDKRNENILGEVIPNLPKIELSKIGLYTDTYRKTLPYVKELLKGRAREAGFNSEEDVKASNRENKK